MNDSSRRILNTLHRVCTGVDMPIEDASSHTAFLCARGRAPLEAATFVIGRDRLGRVSAIPAAYWPLCVIEDGDSVRGRTGSTYAVKLHVGVLVPGRTGALLGTDRDLGRIDFVDKLVNFLWDNDRLLDESGTPMAPGGILGDIGVAVGTVHNDALDVIRQTATISVTYKTTQWR